MIPNGKYVNFLCGLTFYLIKYRFHNISFFKLLKLSSCSRSLSAWLCPLWWARLDGKKRKFSLEGMKGVERTSSSCTLPRPQKAGCLHTAGPAHHVWDIEGLCPQNLLNSLHCPETGMSGVLKSQCEMNWNMVWDESLRFCALRSPAEEVTK